MRSCPFTTKYSREYEIKSPLHILVVFLAPLLLPLVFGMEKISGLQDKPSKFISIYGKNVLLYALTMQLLCGQFANLFRPHFTKDGIRADFEGINNSIAKISNTLAEKISCSALAKPSVGEAVWLRTITGRYIIFGTVIGIVTFGPDVVRTLRGRISKQQLFKNTTVGATVLAGAAIGQALTPIPGLGGVIRAEISG